MEKKFPPDTPELLRSAVELETNLREDFRITEKDPTGAFSLLKAPICAITSKNLRHFAELVLM